MSTSRRSEETGLSQAGIPKLLVDAYIKNKCGKEEMFTIWGIYGKKEKIPNLQHLFCLTLVDLCDDETRIPAAFKGFNLKQLDKEIKKIGQLNRKMLPIVFAPAKERIAQEDIDFMMDIGKRNRFPNLLEAILDQNRSEWTVKSARDTLEYFDEYPEALQEVLDGGHREAVAYKYDLLQF